MATAASARRKTLTLYSLLCILFFIEEWAGRPPAVSAMPWAPRCSAPSNTATLVTLLCPNTWAQTGTAHTACRHRTNMQYLQYK